MAVLAYHDLPPAVRGTAPAGSQAEPWYYSVFWEEQDGKNGAGRGSEHGKKSQELNNYVFEAGRDVRKMDKGTYDRLREAARCVFCDCYHPERAVTDEVIIVVHWGQHEGIRAEYGVAEESRHRVCCAAGRIRGPNKHL